MFTNINGVTDTSEKSTFYAKHAPGVSYLENLTSVAPKVAEYYCFGKVKPDVKENGEYYAGSHGLPICSTSSGSKIGYSTFTIYIEGWDHSVVDKAAGYQFNLGLKFEIDRT